MPRAALARGARRVALAALAALCIAPMRQVGATTPWAHGLATECARLEAEAGARLGVSVRDLDTGESFGCRSGETWYLASTVKVPIAIEVLRGVDAGRWTLHTPVTLRAADLVDGGPLAGSRPVGSVLTVRELLELMIVHSDNTASDMLIGLVGESAVNALVRDAAPGGFERITPLGDVRRRIYARLAPEAVGLDGDRLLALARVRGDEARLQTLSHLTGRPVPRMRARTLQAAYDGYYASGLNSGRLDAYVGLLAALQQGRLLSGGSTALLLDLMTAVVTGPLRIKAGLPADARFAHKTGTQRGRVCDAGIVSTLRADGGERRLVVAACTSDARSLARAESALRGVGLALCRSGALDRGADEAALCPVEIVPLPVRDDDAPR